jgi:ABC-type multidrug transport system fused ATPase/permease subunit
MSQGLDLPQAGFRAPRVPLDLRCVMLGAVAWLAVRGLDLLLAWALKATRPVAQLVDLVADQIGQVAFIGPAFRMGMAAIWGQQEHSLAWWETLVTALLFLAVWSVFGAAILRTAALKLTREEPLSLREALRFGGKNGPSFLLAPVLVVAFAGFFVLCNAAAGLLMSIPLVGSSLLALVLFPLVLVSSLLVVLALLGGFVGLPLMWAGIAIEQNGPLEALSRAFSYIFARPFRFFFGYFLVFVVMTVVVVAGSHFERTVKETVKLGVWNDNLDSLISLKPREPDVLHDPFKEAERPQLEEDGIGNLRNIERAGWTEYVGFFWMWLLLSAFVLGIHGYALYLFLGGTVSLYLQLRREVDGTEEEEIYPESEADAAPPAEARWVGTPPNNEPPPASGGGASAG